VLILQFVQHFNNNYFGNTKLILILNFHFAAFWLKAGHHVYKTTTNKIKPKLKSRYKLSFIFRPILTITHRTQTDPLSTRTIFLASYISDVKVRMVNLLLTVTDKHSDSQH